MIAENQLSTMVPDDENTPASWPGWIKDGKVIKNTINQQFTFSGPNKNGEPPILTLTDDVSSWSVGDKIVVASTSWDPRESETFYLVDCPNCNAKQGIECS